MYGTRRDIESRFLEQVARYRDEYRSGRAAAVNEERERRHASGEVYIAGSWVPRADASRVVEGLQRHEYQAFFEIVVLVGILFANVIGMWQLFAFLFLP